MSPESTPTPDLIRLLQRISHTFRLGMEADGNAALIEVGDALEPWLQAAAPGARQHVNAVLEDLVTAQERGDTLRIADLAEFELLPQIAAVPAD